MAPRQTESHPGHARRHTRAQFLADAILCADNTAAMSTVPRPVAAVRSALDRVGLLRARIGLVGRIRPAR